MRQTRLTLDPEGLCPAEERALIGVSGGRDSVALLHALWQRGHKHLVVCHWDHAWRPESATDAAFVVRLAAALGYPAVVERAASAVPREAAGRAQRLEFFARVAAQHSCGSIYLAHHADDQVETFLLHLLRGAGAHGLGGMATRSPHRVGDRELVLLRPLLGTWRKEIDAYLSAEGLEALDDPSNHDPRYARNRLRHELLPGMEEACGHDPRPMLWRAAQILAAEDAHLSALPEVQAPEGPLRVADLRALSPALQRRLARSWLLRAGIEEPSFTEVESVRGLVAHRFPAKVNLQGARHVRRRAGWLYLDPA
jgi:tRNA(Ile)-lysidine synthetase-like protein